MPRGHGLTQVKGDGHLRAQDSRSIRRRLSGSAVPFGDRVTVRKAPVTFRLVKVPGKTYYQTLREKLRWGTMPNYRNEPEGA